MKRYLIRETVTTNHNDITCIFYLGKNGNAMLWDEDARDADLGMLAGLYGYDSHDNANAAIRRRVRNTTEYEKRVSKTTYETVEFS